MTVMYQTKTVLRRRLFVHYPPGRGRIVVRTDLDWDRDLEPSHVSPDGEVSTFTFEARRPFLYFKTCLKTTDGRVLWTIGPNMLLLMTSDDAADVHPYFEGSARGSFSTPIKIPSSILGRDHILRAYLPAGYDENPLRRFPVLYMQDGKNLFFPEEAFMGRDWGVDEALTLLDTMNFVDRAVIVGIYSGDRMTEYTKPGYEAYARSVVEEIKPFVDGRFRVKGSPSETAVIGSSLGGVVSFYMAWQHPEVFGAAACMSSTFSHKDDLIERVLSEPKSKARFYLDSGWPGDNYEVTLAMAMAFVERGYRVREEFIHLAFPLDEHDETAWGRRIHLPLQLMLGRTGVAARRSLI
jgi:predicted alpha/beta superfamily hydrolase